MLKWLKRKRRPPAQSASAARRTSKITIRVTEEERRKLKDSAARDGQTLTAYLVGAGLREDPD